MNNNTAVKTKQEPSVKNYAEYLDELEDQFLDAPHQKDFMVPQGGFSSPALTVKTDRVGVSYPEAAIVMFFSFALGFWLGVSHTNQVINGAILNKTLDEVAGYLVIGLLPTLWAAGVFLFFRNRKRTNGKI